LGGPGAGLAALHVSFDIAGFTLALNAVYCFGEYLFGLLLLAGCREYVGGRTLTPADGFWLVPAALVAGTVASLPGEFSVRFAPQALIQSGLYAASWLVLNRMPSARPLQRPGLRTALVALAALTAVYALHSVVALFTALGWKFPTFYQAFIPIFNLLLSALLGFSLVTLVMEDTQTQLLKANEELRRMRDELERLARVDDLTGALTRHAFHAFSREPVELPPRTGCVVVVDVDDLKPVNDAWGHAAGDAMLRHVADGIRALLRTEDAVFRWGGDEFLVVMLHISPQLVRERFNRLSAHLETFAPPGMNEPIAISASFGVAPFSGRQEMKRAIDIADIDMYRAKQLRKAGRRLQDQERLGIGE